MVNESGRNHAANYFLKKINKQINGFRLQSSLSSPIFVVVLSCCYLLPTFLQPNYPCIFYSGLDCQKISRPVHPNIDIKT